MRNILITTALLALAWPAIAQDAAPDGPILFTNVDVFDGTTLELMPDMNVVVTGNLVT